MTENHSVMDNVLAWLHDGYPEGVPPKDYFALLALLKRSLTEDQVVKAAQTVLKGTDSDTVTDEEIREAIQQVTDKEPNPEEIHQVASRLASVGVAIGGARSLNRIPTDGPRLTESGAVSVPGVASQRVGFWHLDEDQQDAVGIDDVQFV